MPVSVATADELTALTARVAALESAQPIPTPTPTPPTPTPSPVVVTGGVQAQRIADLVEILGVNTFSAANSTSNVWGSWPSDYSAATVIAAHNWLTAGSGFVLAGREYHYAGRETIQAPWLKQVVAATNMPFAMCVGANGTASDVASMLALASDQSNGIAWVEGVNEPNTNFGSGMETLATVEAVQAAVYKGAGSHAVGPSIVFGLPDPEVWINAYASVTDLALLLTEMSFANGHLYPPTMCDADDGSGRGGAFDDVVAGLARIYPGKQLLATEFHPTLYSRATPPIVPGGPLDAYYTLLALLAAKRSKLGGLWWFALFDYKDPTQPGYMPCGLFPTNATNPRASAWAIHALCALTGDKGATKRTFTPGSYADTVTGLPPPIDTTMPHTGGHTELYQSSDGRLFRLIWNAQIAMGGASTPVTVTFAKPPTMVTEYNISLGTAASMTPIQRLSLPSSLVCQLDASVRLLVIAP